MRNLRSWALRGAFAVFATCGFVTCQHEAPGPSIAPREAPPAAPRPRPMPPVGVASPCPGLAQCPDGGMPIDPGAVQERGTTPPVNPGPGADLAPARRAQLQTADVVPESVSPKKPPLDAGTDGPINLPPLPDGGPIKTDAAQPMK